MCSKRQISETWLDLQLIKGNRKSKEGSKTLTDRQRGEHLIHLTFRYHPRPSVNSFHICTLTNKMRKGGKYCGVQYVKCWNQSDRMQLWECTWIPSEGGARSLVTSGKHQKL